MDWLKSQWSSWKVKVSVVGGALVIATAYGTCEVDPNAVSADTTEAATETTTETSTETVEVSATTTAETAANTAGESATGESATGESTTGESTATTEGETATE